MIGNGCQGQLVFVLLRRPVTLFPALQHKFSRSTHLFYPIFCVPAFSVLIHLWCLLHSVNFFFIIGIIDCSYYGILRLSYGGAAYPHFLARFSRGSGTQEGGRVKGKDSTCLIYPTLLVCLSWHSETKHQFSQSKTPKIIE